MIRINIDVSEADGGFSIQTSVHDTQFGCTPYLQAGMTPVDQEKWEKFQPRHAVRATKQETAAWVSDFIHDILK